MYKAWVCPKQIFQKSLLAVMFHVSQFTLYESTNANAKNNVIA